MKHKIIILDFESSKVVIRDYNNKEWDDSEDAVIALGFSPINCQWMVVKKLKLKIDIG